MPKLRTDFDDIETPVMPPLALRFDPAGRQYHRDDEEPAARDAIAKDDGEPAERSGAQRA